MEHRLDFVAIGDITTDSFIRLSGDEATVIEDGTRSKKICFNFGDKIEFDFVKDVYAVGNSPNAAVSASRIGLSSALVANLGDDALGDECIASLTRDKVITDFVARHKGMTSNHHYVLWYGAERTILVKHEAYPYTLPDIGTPSWLYLSSMGEHSLALHHDIARYLREHDGIKLTFQPGTFQMRFGKNELRDIYESTHLFFCNREEAARILETQERDIKMLLQGIHDLGPRIVAITDGPDGAYTYDGAEMLYIPMYPDIAPPVDRTGAGDAFASTFTALVAQGRTISEALIRAPINSMSVAQKIGAQEGLLTLEELETYLAQAPEWYKPKSI